MKKTTLLNKGRPLILTSEQSKNIQNEIISAIITPLTNKELFKPGEYIYCKEPTIIVPTDHKEDFISKYNLDNSMEFKGKCYFYGSIIVDEEFYIPTISKQMPKDVSRLFLKLTSAYTCNIKSLINTSTMKLIGCNTEEELESLWETIIDNYLYSTKNDKLRNKLSKTLYYYDNDPIVQVIIFDKINLEE